MRNRFAQYIRKNNLVLFSDKLLLAVSGGVDSMVMARLFLECNFKFSVAHCNFNLRDKESDSDQKLVEEFANSNNLELHITSFDTASFAKENNISIQMAARELRYNWFSQLKKEFSYTKIATAHNSDDNVETFFLNLLRGTGLTGLTGIQVNNNTIIRPVLFAPREDIEIYAKLNNVSFRNDSSNKDNKYARNKIRLDILPQFEEIRPNFKQKMLENIDYIKQVSLFVESKLELINKQYVQIKSNLVYISTEIAKELSADYILFEILQKYGFKGETIKQILGSLTGESGKQFFSDTHVLTKDREFLIISEQQKQVNKEYVINRDLNSKNLPFALSFCKIEKDSKYKIPNNSVNAHLDFEKLIFPLTLRKWQEGDSFIPLGMSGNKKLSDFFIDEKLSLIEKEQQWVLVSGKDIVWIVGKRIDNRYRITNSTQNILSVSY